MIHRNIEIGPDSRSQIPEVRTPGGEDARKAEIEILKTSGEKMSDKPNVTPDQVNTFAVFVTAVITIVVDDDKLVQLKLACRQSQFTTYLSFLY